MRDVSTQVQSSQTESSGDDHTHEYDQIKHRLSSLLVVSSNGMQDGSDDEAPMSRLQQIEYIKKQSLEVLHDLDTMRDGINTHMKVMAEILRLLENDENASAAFAAPLVEEAAGRVKTGLMHWAAGVASLQVARIGMTKSLVFKDLAGE